MNTLDILGIIFIAVVIFNVLFFWFMTRAAKLKRKQQAEEARLREKSLFHAEFFSTNLGFWCGWFRHEGVVKQGYVTNLEDQALRKGSCCDVFINGFDHEIGRWELEAILADDED